MPLTEHEARYIANNCKNWDDLEYYIAGHP